MSEMTIGDALGIPKPQSWRVLFPNVSRSDYLKVRASRCFVVEGHLIFKNIDGALIRAFAPGHWAAVVQFAKLRSEIADSIRKQWGPTNEK